MKSSIKISALNGHKFLALRSMQSYPKTEKHCSILLGRQDTACRHFLQGTGTKDILVYIKRERPQGIQLLTWPRSSDYGGDKNTNMVATSVVKDEGRRTLAAEGAEHFMCI